MRRKTIPPEMVGHTYPGTVKSAIARAKRALIGAGFPWSVTKGRYYPFGNEQKTSDGVRVRRIGCSDTIGLMVVAPHGPREGVRLVEGLAIGTLREAGLPVDDRGWLLCEASS